MRLFKPMFSIIVPVYNAELYIAECLDSVLGQNCKNFEIICIDDGSIDGSASILDRYSERYSRVRVFHQANAGVSSARNRGIKEARGEYIFFLDADDYIAEESLKHIKDLIRLHSPDIIVVGGVSTPPSFWDALMATRDAVYKDNFVDALLEEKGSRPLIAGKLYRTSFLRSRNILFDEGLKLGEDQAFQFATFPHASCIVFSQFKCYYYRQRSGSAMASVEEDRSAKMGLHFKLSRVILQRLLDEGVLGRYAPDFAHWFVDFVHDDILALPNRQAATARDEFAMIVDEFFPDAVLDANTERMVDEVKSICTDEDPVVSIVVPVHNSAKYLQQSFGSICRQTMRRFELIYVDDGSTDSSREMLAKFETNDTRVRVVHQNHSGAGSARNAGIDLARGSYLLFLDADDFFDPDMLEELLNCAKRYDSEICVCRARGFDANSGVFIPMPWTCDLSLSEFELPFSRQSAGEMIYCFTSPAPWNKLLKTSFVRNKNLRFQNLPNSNDAFFTIMALSLADRICAIERELVSYRVNNAGSLQGSKREHPLAFFEALISIKENLEEAGIYDDLERPFINFAFDLCIYNLQTCAQSEGGSAAFETIFTFLRSEGLSRLGLLGRSEDSFYAYSGENHLWYSDLLTSKSVIDFAKARNLPPFSVIEERDREIARLEKEVDELRSSYSFRIGSALLVLPRKIRDVLGR